MYVISETGHMVWGAGEQLLFGSSVVVAAIPLTHGFVIAGRWMQIYDRCDR
ncbi:Uncharacterised protein [Mycobacteroides abscessus subsp. bolletii]|nr:Uncharacterised protein [Mycobacteroides abscessus subsp. bolletii]SLF02274.1 Uncharacterised protein [Mycobacteroides abscessus subsp. bolletii]